MMKHLLAALAIALCPTTAQAVEYRPAIPSGLTAFDAQYYARINSHKVVVFSGTCTSSCAILWNLAKRKCAVGGSVQLRQHKFSANGEKINVHSKDVKYWLRLGRQGPPSRQMVSWTGKAKACPASQSSSSDDFNRFGIRESQCAGNPNCIRRKQRLGKPPSIFQ